MNTSYVDFKTTLRSFELFTKHSRNTANGPYRVITVMAKNKVCD